MSTGSSADRGYAVPSQDISAGTVTQKESSPALSLIMPCYNEDAIVGYSVQRLVTAFDRAGHRLQLITVDNGSRDRTGEELTRLSAQFPDVVQPTRVDVNRGYGYGILFGVPLCEAPWIGIIPADGQVDAEDVVRLFEALKGTDGWVVGKVRRRFRLDGLMRKFISIGYNGFARLLWPSLRSIDLNGTPKILPRALFEQLDLQSHDWLLDPEILIKSHYLGAQILEFNVFGRMRGNGLSHVSGSTAWHFFVALLRLRFSSELSEWRRSTPARPDVAKGDLTRASR